MTVTGHSDAHFGNVFLEEQEDYLYFDPAFAGNHAPLLDIIKPLFHNVFAAWMYFPQEIARELKLSVTIRDTNIYVEHNYDLAPVRRAIFHTKLEYLLAPLLQMLVSRNALPEDWIEIVPLALMCWQLLADHHEEGEVDGLGLFRGEVRRIPHGPKIPHMGWNTVTSLREGLPIFADIPPNAYFYFAHSYYVEPQDRQGVAAMTDYGSPYCSVIVGEHVWGTQFHPEKSGAAGLQLLRNFMKWVRK